MLPQRSPPGLVWRGDGRCCRCSRSQAWRGSVRCSRGWYYATPGGSGRCPPSVLRTGASAAPAARPTPGGSGRCSRGLLRRAGAAAAAVPAACPTSPRRMIPWTPTAAETPSCSARHILPPLCAVEGDARDLRSALRRPQLRRRSAAEKLGWRAAAAAHLPSDPAPGQAHIESRLLAAILVMRETKSCGESTPTGTPVGARRTLTSCRHCA